MIESRSRAASGVAPVAGRAAKPILVTGGSGFTGGHLIRALWADGLHVQTLARGSSRLDHLPDGVDVVCGDLGDPDALRKAVAGVDIVFHLAAAFRQARLPDRVYHAINVEATERLVEAAAAAGVRRFVHCSTCGVHGDVKGGTATEESPLRPGDVYQRTKLLGEEAARRAAERTGLNLAIARPTGIYGPGDRRLLKLFRAVARRRFVMLGPGDVRYHLTHVDDVVRGLRLCAERPDAVGRTYLLAGPTAPTLRELVSSIARAAGVPAPTRHWPLRPFRMVAAITERVCRPLGIEPPLHGRRLDFFVKDRAFDASRASRELGFDPSVTLEEGIAGTMRWYREHGWV